MPVSTIALALLLSALVIPAQKTFHVLQRRHTCPTSFTLAPYGWLTSTQKATWATGYKESGPAHLQLPALLFSRGVCRLRSPPECLTITSHGLRHRHKLVARSPVHWGKQTLRSLPSTTPGRILTSKTCLAFTSNVHDGSGLLAWHTGYKGRTHVYFTRLGAIIIKEPNLKTNRVKVTFTE